MALIQMAEYIESLGMEDLVSIVVPDHDFQNRVLYLLHGMMGDYSSYFREHDMERLANEKGVLIVMPSVQNSIYTNMEHGGAFVITWQKNCRSGWRLFSVEENCRSCVTLLVAPWEEPEP